MKIENLNIFDRVNSAKDQTSGSAARSSQKEDQKSSQGSESFAKLLGSDKKSIKKDVIKKESSFEKQDAPEASPEPADSSVETSSAGDYARKPIPDRNTISVPRNASVGSSVKNEPTEEVRSAEETKKPSAPTEFDATGTQLNRRVAMQTFLRKMKEQLNVQPEQIMAAFGSLSIEELTNPPEMNLEKIIQGLNLSEQQKPVAKQLFEDMMKQTAANSMAEYLKNSGQQLALQVTSQKEIQQKALDQSITKMNQNFFMADQKPMLQNPVLAKQQMPNPMMSEQQLVAQDENQQGMEIPGFIPTAGKMEMPAHLAPTANPMAAAQSLPSENAAEPVVAPEKTAGKLTAKAAPAVASAEVPAAAAKAVTPEWLSALMPQAKGASASSLFSEASSDSDDDTALDTSDLQDLNAPQIDAGQLEKLKAALQAQANTQDNSEGKKEDGSTQELNIQPQAGQAKPAGFDKAIASLGLNSKQPTPGQESSNVKELINQAQFMIKKGGGEMKVRLTPEGLGEVAMRVNVRDGQVSVEMITESNEAKSLIEKGLGDLKATLASHKLNVDHIKVDLAQNTAKDFQQQHENAGRHQAQQFMEEFRQDNQQWRQSFYDVPGAKAYKSQTRDEADNSYLTPQSSRKSGSSSRRLDLVA